MLEKSKQSGKEMEVFKTSIGDLMATPGALIELKVQKDGVQSLQKNRKNEYLLGKLCQGEMFGEREVIKERKRKTTIKCVTLTGLLLKLEANHFLRMKSDAEQWSTVTKETDLKKDLFKERKNVIHEIYAIKPIDIIKDDDLQRYNEKRKE